jgi:antitoxin component HigA of HigAB toxin-antitoxin module
MAQLNINLKANFNQIRLFHSCLVNKSDEELKKRINSLNSLNLGSEAESQSVNLNEELNLNDSIILTDTQAETLEKTVEILKELHLNSDNFSEKDRKFQEIQSNISTFEEADPNFGKNDNDSTTSKATFNESENDIENSDVLKDISGFISKLTKVDSEEISSVLKDNGLIKELQILANNTNTKEILAEKNIDISDSELIAVKEQISELEEKCIKISADVSSVKNDLTEIQDISKKTDTGLEVSKNALDFFIKNQSNLNMIIGTTAMISPILAYKGLFSAYSKFMIPKIPKNTGHRALMGHMAMRRKFAGSFNRVAVPLLLGYYIYVQHYHKMFTTKFNFNESGSISTSSIGIFSKLPKWMSLLMIPIIIIVIYGVIRPIFKHNFPLLYGYLQELTP